MVLKKKLKFFHRFISGPIIYKNKKLKSPKIGIFPKGLLHGFGQKFENFQSFILLAKSASKISLTIFQKKKRVFRL